MVRRSRRHPSPPAPLPQGARGDRRSLSPRRERAGVRVMTHRMMVRRSRATPHPPPLSRKGQGQTWSPSPSTEGRGEGDDAPHDGATMARTPTPCPSPQGARGAVLATGTQRAVRDPRQLCELLDLPAELVPAAIRAAEQFPLFVPRPYLNRMDPRQPATPLLRKSCRWPTNCSRRRSSRAIRSAIWRPSKRRACCRNIGAGYCSSPPGPARSIAATASAAIFPTRRCAEYGGCHWQAKSASGRLGGGFHLARPLASGR